jgi:hypothetical protein
MVELSAEHLSLLLRIKQEIEDGQLDSYLTMRLPIRSKSQTLRTLSNNKTKKGGGLDKKSMVLILFSIVFIISFSVEYNHVREYFESLLIQPTLYWETILLPFLSRLKDIQHERHNLAITLFGKTVHTVVIPSIKGIYKKMTDSFTGDALALNGLWSLWTNMNKLKDYMKEPKLKNEITPEKMKEIYENGLKDIHQIMYYVSVPKDFKLFNIPYGSKLITNKSICDS